MPPILGAIISSNLASYHELETVYGVEDAYNLLEIINVNNHNQRAVDKWQQSKNL